MKKLSLYIFLFLLTLTTISKADVFIKCDHISGSFDKKIISQLKYIQFSNTLSDKKYWQNGEWRYYKKSFSYWDKKEQRFIRTTSYYARIQDYRIYNMYDGNDFKKTVKIDRETGILTFSGNTFQCNKINKSDLPIIEVIQKF